MIPTLLILAIDGHAGAGKTSLIQILAGRLIMKLLDSGSFYRAAAYIHRDKHADMKRISIIEGVLCIDGAPVTSGMIRTPEIAMRASAIAKDLRVREALLPLFRQYAREAKRLIAEGRDMTSVVFRDDAVLKIFLTADPYVRAQRIVDDPERGKGRSLPAVYAETIWRDHQDETRLDAPLIKVPDAIPVDSTRFTISETADVVEDLWHRKLNMLGA